MMSIKKSAMPSDHQAETTYEAIANPVLHLIPYFITAHPGTSDEDMLNLALWLKKNGFRADQV
ncbi:hypothetical protein [Candidatus Thiothrix phosphatis]|uniref:hypothetical protein n=1 Tax=Candidatus Thiothrix phosphatis TaxID=3112415 RepID=UPI0035C8BFC1